MEAEPNLSASAASCTEPSTVSRRAALATGAAVLAGSCQWQSATVAAPADGAAGAITGANAGAIPTAALAPDLQVTQVIKGCWQLSGSHRGDSATDRTSGSEAVQDLGVFARAGITTFDTADHYGPSEQLIGRFLRDAGSAANDVTVLTKACIWGPNLGSVGRGNVLEKEYIDVSRQRLGRPTLDLLQFYWHDYSQPNFVAAAQQLADMQAAGKIRRIGLTNFDVPRVAEMLDAGVPLVSNQVQYSLLDRRPDNGMVDFCLRHGMQLLPYGVVAGGLLSDRYLGVQPSQVQLETVSKRKYASVLGASGDWAWFQRLLRTLRGIGDAHGGASIANVATRWVLQRPAVGAVILGARNARHVADHQALFSFQLDAQDCAAIDEVLAQARRPRGDCYSWERGGVF